MPKWNPCNLVHILGVSLGLAAYSAWVLPARERGSVFLGSEGSIPAADIPLLGLADAQALWRDSSTVFLDVRSSIDYAFGHIEGAVSLPEEEFKQRFPDFKPRLEKARVLVVYCKNTDCGKSFWCALRLRKEGLTQTVIYPAGWNEWHERDLPVSSPPAR